MKTPQIHTSDYLAWQKYASGEWDYNVTTGTIHSRITGQPVPFRKTRSGYLITTVLVHGMKATILKHRAVWIAAHGILALPLDYTLEIDHINHDKTDCRLINLRLIPPGENRRTRTGSILPADAREIRRKYDTGTETIQDLAMEYFLSRYAVSRLVHRKTYCDPAYEPEENP